MATLRNKRKLAAVSRETPESTRSGRTQSLLDPELTQDYISQVSEEIEGRVTKRLSKVRNSKTFSIWIKKRYWNFVKVEIPCPQMKTFVCVYMWFKFWTTLSIYQHLTDEYKKHNAMVFNFMHKYFRLYFWVYIWIVKKSFVIHFPRWPFLFPDFLDRSFARKNNLKSFLYKMRRSKSLRTGL